MTKPFSHRFSTRGHAFRVAADARGRFDELVVLIGRAHPPKFMRLDGKTVRNPKYRRTHGNLVLHAEMMDDRSCFIDVAGVAIWVHVGRDGVARITMSEDRRPGVKGRVDLRDPALDGKPSSPSPTKRRSCKKERRP